MLSRFPSVILALATAGALAAQPELPPGVLVLSKVKRTMKAALENVPNYTCIENIEREQLAPKARAFKLLDTVRLEVAELGERELYSWPGASKFEERSLTDFTSVGMAGSGIFALHARTVFMSNAASFEYRGEEQFQGHPAYRYDFRVPYMFSGYTISANGHSAKVAERGSFWVDRNLLDLSRIEVLAEDIPPDLGIAEAVTRIDYGRVSIGGAEALLPQSAELLVKHFDGAASRNRIEFTHCRQYGSESVITFSEPPQGGAVAPPPPQEINLPPGLIVPVVLDAPLDSDKIFVGQLVRGHVRDEVLVNARPVVPAGAAVKGRVRRLEKYNDPSPYFVVGLEFTEVEFPGGRARLFAELQQIQNVSGLERHLQYSKVRSTDTIDRGRTTSESTETIWTRDLPGVGTFFMKGARFELPKGMWMLWKTEPAGK